MKKPTQKLKGSEMWVCTPLFLPLQINTQREKDKNKFKQVVSLIKTS